MLRQGERLDDLQYNGLKIIQNPQSFCFGSDSVALANFVSGRAGERAVDLGTGSGVLAILTAAKCGLTVTGVEIQPMLADMAQRSVALNGLESQIEIVCMPMQNAPARFGRNFDVVMTNPPYRALGNGYVSANESVRRARFEIDVTLREVVACAAQLLKPNGRFYAVYPNERLPELISVCAEHRFSVQEVRHIGKKICAVRCSFKDSPRTDIEGVSTEGDVCYIS